MNVFTRVACTLILLSFYDVPPSLGADIEPKLAPKSPAATSALAKARRVEMEANAAWVRTMAEAKRVMISELKAAQLTAMKSGSLVEANSIEASIVQAAADLELLEGRTAKTTPAANARASEPVATVPQSSAKPSAKPPAKPGKGGGNQGDSGNNNN